MPAPRSTFGTRLFADLWALAAWAVAFLGLLGSLVRSLTASAPPGGGARPI